MKLKVIKLDDGHTNIPSEEAMIGKVFDAISFKSEYEAREDCKNMFALGMKNGVYFIPQKCCEVVEEHTFKTEQSISKNANFPNGILLVEDGSVDIDKLEEDGFYVISYRQGSEPPKFL